MKSSFSALDKTRPEFLCGTLCGSSTVTVPFRVLQSLPVHFISHVTYGEHYNLILIQSTYFTKERKGFAPNLVGSGKTSGEDFCLLTLS